LLGKNNNMRHRINEDSRPRLSCPSRPRRRALALGLALAPLLALPLSASAQGGIEDIGTLGGSYSAASGVSADGSVVVGSATFVGNAEIRAFRWTRGGGMVDLGSLGGRVTYPRVISADGSTVVGEAYTTGNAGGWHAFRWTSGGMVDLGTFGGSYSSANAVSADGSVVVGGAWTTGDAAARAFRWTSAGGMVDLGTLGGSSSSAYAVSADGSVVVGSAAPAGDSTFRAFRWTRGGGMVDLGTLYGMYPSAATHVSADGAVVVGVSYTSSDFESYRIFRWTSGRGMVDLGTLGGTRAISNGISADGSVVVGYVSSVDFSVTRAFRWTSGGMVDLGALGGSYSSANGVSADGAVVVGRSAVAGDVVYRAFRWTQATGIQSVEGWLRAAGVAVPTDITASATATNSDGSVVVGYLANGHPFVARVVGVGSGLVTLADVQTSLGAASTGGNMTLSAAGTVLNGAHSRPLSRRVEPGRNAFWLAGDLGRDDHGARSGDMGLAEVGLGQNLGPAQLNVSLGQTWAKQSLLLNGRAKSVGSYLLAEALLPVAGRLWATVGGYRHWGKADLRRGYLNAGLQDASTGKPGVDTWGLRARLDWDAAYRIASADFSPYVDLSYSEAKLDAYAETGGGFPARFDARRDKATELRAGVNALRPLDNGLRLVGTLEAVHRMERSGARTVGEVIGLFGFDLAGAANQRDWLRVGAGVEGKLAEGTASLSLNLTSKGEAPSAWLAANWQKSF
jgi:probable HAF family extracellular repeat protein